MEVLTLPEGVRLKELKMHIDDRGIFTEAFREEWDSGIRPVQWNVVSSQKGVLRGVHVHIKHFDYLILMRGKAIFGLHDLRINSPTYGLGCKVPMNGDHLKALTIPPGVAHGFYFSEPSTHFYSVSEYWNLADELGCRWDDPDLNINWPFTDAHISDRDQNAQSLRELEEQLAPSQHCFSFGNPS